ncbi:uncharacterized protein LOC126812085 isoform X2 [Patella vulgata]|uniref:uncharacterized protein LOC126812085 isoform X2 n=1 Tax=Patella vulgata TaxID=6465 RepID=UPI0021809A7A|nr:uncharacterized protein LOC126812085 isoform X2 [Patella vulgata]
MSTGTEYSEKPHVENLPVTSRCIAIVLHKIHREIKFENEQSFFSENNGKELLSDFKLRNKTCYWNPGLIESIASLEYLGFVKPCTLLVVGRNLEKIRSAWGSRVLNAPDGFTIDRIGDVNGIEMQVVPQTKSVPLTDALCHIIMELNNQRIVATLDTIREKLQCAYQDIQLPSDKQLFDTLGNLIRERKVFHTGSGYFVVTPETFRLPTTTNESNVTFNNWLQYQPMYIPVFPQQQIPMVTHPPAPAMAPVPAPAQMRTVSCQVESAAPEKQAKGPKPRSRSQSMRGPKGKEKEKSLENEDFKRVMSVRCRPEKAKEITKDINNKNNANQDKVKGEKVSLFSKIFGRNKKKNTPPPPPPVEVEPPAEKEKEYATFSAQFPPPEWQWYQQQQEKHRRTEQWVSQQMVKSRTWHYIQNMGINGGEQPQHVRCNTMDGLARVPAQDPASHNVYSTLGRTGTAAHSDYMVIDALVDPITGAPIDPSSGHYQAKTESGGSNTQEKITQRKSYHDDRRSRENLDKKGRDHPERKSQDCLDRNAGEHGDRKRHGHRKHRSSKNRKERNHDQDENIDPYGVYGAKDPPSPVLASDNFYQPLTSCPGPYHSTPRFYDTIPSRQPREEYGHHVPPANDPHQSTQHHTYQRRSHRHRKKSSHHRNTYYGHGTYNDMDISYEYHGKLPNKNSTYAQSCDSGVNCVGLKTESSGGKTVHKSRESMPLPRPHANKNKNQLDNLPEEMEKPKGDDGYVVMESRPRRLPCNDGYDSSIMETPANTMIVCQAEINHHPIPQIVLDTEPHQANCYEPDVAQSSSSNNGSRVELSSTKDGSVDTVIEKDERAEDCRGNPAGEDNPEEKPECQQDKPIEKPQTQFVDKELKPYKVDSVTLEVKELSLKDSGFSSPRYVEITGGNCPKQPATYQRFQEHMAKPVLKVNNSNNCENVYENQSHCVRDPLHPQFENGRPLPHNGDKCQCHRSRPHENQQQQMVINNQRSIFRLKPDNLVQSQWVDGPASDLPQQQVTYAKQFRLSGEFEVVGVV